MLALDERDALLVEARRFFPAASDREVAHRIRIAMLRYQTTGWQCEQTEARCPPRLAGRLDALSWAILKINDFVPSERLIRAVLARSSIRCPTAGS